MEVEIAVARLPLEKRIVTLPATVWYRSVNVPTPPDAVTVVVPCSVPEPLLRTAVTRLELSEVTRLLYWS